jgi:hypothetical protein
MVVGGMSGAGSQEGNPQNQSPAEKIKPAKLLKGLFGR